MGTPPPLWSRSTDLILERVIVWGGVVLLVGFLILIVLPPVTDRGRPYRRTECKNHFKQLALAMHNYHDKYGSFPPAYIADKNGRPMHSWRVLLLPFLEFDSLYKQYRFDEPWNGPHNRLLAEPAPSLFHCPSDTGTKTDTSYLVVVGPKTIFPGASSIKIADITDGTSNTILMVEAVESGINWLEPRDMSYEEALRGINPKTGWGISSHHEGGAQVAFADGSSPLLSDDTPIEKLRLFLERNDGQTVSWPRY
jgi:prepilin-type processing-associated H-X9-DG protein